MIPNKNMWIEQIGREILALESEITRLKGEEEALHERAIRDTNETKIILSHKARLKALELRLASRKSQIECVV